MQKLGSISKKKQGCSFGHLVFHMRSKKITYFENNKYATTYVIHERLGVEVNNIYLCWLYLGHTLPLINWGSITQST
jgi:hypothetical protein